MPNFYKSRSHIEKYIRRKDAKMQFYRTFMTKSELNVIKEKIGYNDQKLKNGKKLSKMRVSGSP